VDLSHAAAFRNHTFLAETHSTKAFRQEGASVYLRRIRRDKIFFIVFTKNLLLAYFTISSQFTIFTIVSQFTAFTINAIFADFTITTPLRMNFALWI
jgi:hypothetical protein